MKAKEEVTIGKHMETQRAANDTLRDEDFDDLVLRASEGDRLAVSAIAIALGGQLVEQARIALKGLDGHAEDVVQDFLLFLLEAKGPFNRADGPAMQWMFRIVRTIARQRRRDWQRYREPPDDEVT